MPTYNWYDLPDRDLEPPERVEPCEVCGKLISLLDDEYIGEDGYYYHLECWDEGDDDE